MGELNLIHLFDFYLASMFLLGTLRRFEQYRAIGGILVAAPGRWPRLLKEMKQHRGIFLTWSTIRPAALTLSLLVINAIASRLIWPHANVTPNDLWREWYCLPLFGVALGAMLAVDSYFLIRVGRINRSETELYLDKAEHWLTTWKAPVVRFFTLGYIDPRRMVSEETRSALTEISNLINRNLYWMSLQVGLRVAFGLVLWGSWALFGPTTALAVASAPPVWFVPI
jgi:hypothetical protein